MSSKYKQLLEVAKTYSFAEILEPKNFVFIEEMYSNSNKFQVENLPRMGTVSFLP